MSDAALPYQVLPPLSDDELAALTPEHRHQLEVVRGIPADILDEEGVYSLRPGDPLPTPDPAFRNPNSHKGQWFPTWPSELTSGIVFPNRDHAGRPNHRIRPDTPLPERGKYESCGGARLSVYILARQRHLIDDITVPILLTEGIQKAMAAVGQLGDTYLVLGLSGVDCWSHKPDPNAKTELGPGGRVASEPLPDWEHIPLRGRIVAIGFDSDRATNTNVQHAERRVTRDLLEPRGAAPIVVQIPPGPNGAKQGIDDFIANGGDLKQLLHRALVTALLRPKPTVPPTGTDGGETCRSCQAREDADREQRTWELMRKRGGWALNAATVVRSYAQATQTAIETGRATIALAQDDTTRVTGVSGAGITRTHRVLTHLQRDPAIAALLPFHIERPEKRGDYHRPWRIVVACDEQGRPIARTTDEMAAIFARIPLPKLNPLTQGDGTHGGARWRCPQPEHAQHGVIELVRRFFRCAAPGCRERCEVAAEEIMHGVPDQEEFHDESGLIDSQEPLPFLAGDQAEGDHFHDESGSDDEVRGAAEGDQFHDESGQFHGDDSQDVNRSRHRESGPLIPVAFTSADDQLAAKRPHSWGDAPPEEPEPGGRPAWIRPEHWVREVIR